jgi:hypothetical protein
MIEVSQTMTMVRRGVLDAGMVFWITDSRHKKRPSFSRWPFLKSSVWRGSRNIEDIAGMDDVVREAVGGFEAADVDAVIEADAIEVVSALDGVGFAGGSGTGSGCGRGVGGFGVSGLLLVGAVVGAGLSGGDVDVVVIGGLVGALFGLAVGIGAVAVSVGVGIRVVCLLAALAGSGGKGENAGEGGNGDGRDFHDQARAPVKRGI